MTYLLTYKQESCSTRLTNLLPSTLARSQTRAPAREFLDPPKKKKKKHLSGCRNLLSKKLYLTWTIMCLNNEVLHGLYLQKKLWPMNVGGWLFLHAGQPLPDSRHPVSGPKSKGSQPPCLCRHWHWLLHSDEVEASDQNTRFAKAPPRFVVTEPKPTIDDAPRLSGFKHGSYHEMSLDFTRIFSLRCFIHSMF